MTVPSENNSDMTKPSDPESKPATDTSAEPAKKAESEQKADGAEAGKALAPAGAGPINPFLAAASTSAEGQAEAPIPPRPFHARILDYSAHAAIIVGLIGFAWTVSGHVVSRPKSETPATPIAASALPSKPVDEMAQLRLANQKLHDEIRALRASVDTLRTAVRRDTSPEQVRVLTAGLETVKGSISSNTAAIAQLNGKVDKLQPGKIAERLARLERQALDPSSTGSIAKPDPKSDSAKSESGKSDQNHGDTARNVPKPPVKPTTLASNEQPEKSDSDKPQVISGWVVRDVYQGVALIEGRRGTMEIVPGVAIPGAGVVKSIERHNGGWVVTTSKGQFASAAAAPQHDSRRDSYRHDPYGRSYGGYRYDY